MPRARREVGEKSDAQLSIRVSNETKRLMQTVFHLGVAMGVWSNWNQAMKYAYTILSAILAYKTLRGEKWDVDKAIECVVKKLDECGEGIIL